MWSKQIKWVHMLRFAKKMQYRYVILSSAKAMTWPLHIPLSLAHQYTVPLILHGSDILHSNSTSNDTAFLALALWILNAHVFYNSFSQAKARTHHRYSRRLKEVRGAPVTSTSLGERASCELFGRTSYCTRRIWLIQQHFVCLPVVQLISPLLFWCMCPATAKHHTTIPLLLSSIICSYRAHSLHKCYTNNASICAWLQRYWFAVNVVSTTFPRRSASA